MSQESPTKTGKRARTSSENNTSFVQNVTSRVSCLLPSKFTKWFRNQSSPTGNGSPPTADATDSLPTADGSDSSDDDTVNRSVITVPPTKRMRFSSSSSSSYHHYGPSEAGCSGSDVEVIDLAYGPFAGPQYGQTPSRNTFTTSMQPPNDEPESLDRDSSHVFKLPHTVSSIGQSIAGKRKSIFDTTSTEESVRKVAKSAKNTMRDPKQPNFKPSLLGSPFYPGRTMYGGAASSTYINQPNINRKTEAVVNEPKSIDDTAISGSARRIVDLFESFTSPLMEARRIPLFKKPNNDGFHNTSSDRFSPYKKKPTYKTQELHVPRIAELLCFKKRSRLMETSNVARQLIASHSSASDFPSYPTESKGKEPEMEQAQKMTTKVKARVTRNNRGTVDLHEMATPVKLPTVPLPLDNNSLPQLSFTTAVVSTPATAPPKIVLPTASKHETVTNSDFIFSHPVKVSNEITQACSTTLKFTFDSPERRIDQKFESKCDDCFVVVGVVKKPESCTNKTKESEYSSCANCWDKTKAGASKCVCCGSKKSVQNVKCSVCKLADSQSQKDKCANCEKMSVSQVVSPLMPKSTGIGSSSKWKCEDCWVSNEESAAKCACCGGSRPKRVSSEASTAAATTSTSTLHADSAICKPVPVKAVPATPNVDADWKCDDCWISNKSSVDKCAACGGARPGVKQTGATNVPTNTKSFFGSSDDKFKNIIKSQKSEKWECSTCLVRNESEQDKCVCCGGEKENKKKIPGPKFNFGKINNSFKFGIDPKVQEATIAEKPEIISRLDSKLKTQSETNNNVLAVTPTFTFTLPKKSIENESDASKANSEETPKSNITFRIPKLISTNTVVTNKEANKEEEEKLQEVPSVDLNAPVQSNPPIVSLQTQTNNETSRTLHNALKDDGKKNTSLNSVDVAVPLSEEKPKPTFSFGLSPSTKMFEPPASTGTSMNLFTQTAQSTTPTTSATTLSMFKPPENSAPSTSLFQQPDLTPKPAPLFPNSESTNNTAAVPMFSFGNNTPSNPAPPAALTLPAASEKPKFHFTFGSNPTPSIDPPSLFKSPFGATESSNAPANTFSISAGTALGSNNTLATNSLGGSNGLTAANGITGNAMADSSLGSMAGNSISSPIGNGSTLGGTNGLSANPLSGTSSMQPGNILTGATPSMFNNTVQKENVWARSTPNLFAANSTSSSLQKPPTFTFGSSTMFNANTAFGSGMPSQNVFNMNIPTPNNTQPSMFTNAVQSQPTGNLFGSATSPQPTPPASMFGARNASGPAAFGSPNTSVPSFEAPSHTPAPSFSFGAPQSTGIFGFGQQQQQQQQQMQQHLQPQQLQHQASPGQTGVYSFGGAPAGAPQVQFSMGSGANPAVRRVRKAVRRNPQR